MKTSKTGVMDWWKREVSLTFRRKGKYCITWIAESKTWWSFGKCRSEQSKLSKTGVNLGPVKLKISKADNTWWILSCNVRCTAWTVTIIWPRPHNTVIMNSSNATSWWHDRYTTADFKPKHMVTPTGPDPSSWGMLENLESWMFLERHSKSTFTDGRVWHVVAHRSFGLGTEIQRKFSNEQKHTRWTFPSTCWPLCAGSNSKFVMSDLSKKCWEIGSCKAWSRRTIPQS